jgi:uncharacterized protein
MNVQKIALFGTSGETTQRLVTEALRRGHNITAIVGNETEFTMKHPNLKVVKGDVRKKEDVKKYASGHDVVICVHEPSQTNPREHVDITRSVIEGVKGSGIHNLVSTAHPWGQPAERTGKEYEDFKPIVKAQQEALKLFQNEKNLQWGYIHSIQPESDEKTGKFRTGNELLLTTPEGETRIPVKEYASAIIDEAEKGEMEFHQGEEEEREY